MAAGTWKGRKPGLRRDALSARPRAARDSKLNRLRNKERDSKTPKPFDGAVAIASPKKKKGK